MSSVELSASDPGLPPRQPRPPAFVPCYICKKEFGSRSIGLHEPRCLLKWRVANDALPKSDRANTPVRPDVGGQSRIGRAGTNLNASWPESSGLIRASMSNSVSSSRVCRPRTATLKKPVMLDADKCQDFDMSLTRCKELLEIVSLNRSLKSGSDSETVVKGEVNGRKVDRPKTIRLRRATRDLNVPNIDKRSQKSEFVSSSDLSTQSNGGGSNAKKRLPNFTRALEELIQASSRAKVRPPNPCTSCGKNANPERLHSHPAEPTASAPAAKRQRPAKKRMSVQRPVAMRYKAPPPPSDDKEPSPPAPPVLDPVAKRKQQLEDEQREKQARLKEDYLKKEERSRRTREEALRKKLAFAVSKYERPANGPRFMVCYICGQQFGDNSLPIHQPQCLEKWRRGNEALPKAQRRPEPQPPPDLPEGSTIQDYNDAATQLAKEVPETSGRRTQPDRGHKHERNTRSKKPAISELKTPAEKAQQDPLCYICKLRFPAEELAKHEEDCVRRWRIDNEITADKILVTQTSHTSVQPGEAVDAHKEGPVEALESQLDAMIDAAWQSHVAELVPCRRCGRTFFPDRLQKHVKNCRINASGIQPEPSAKRQPLNK